jgi:hypothetical protein
MQNEIQIGNNRAPYKESSKSRRKAEIRMESNPATYRSEHTLLFYSSRGDKDDRQSRPKQNHTARIHSPHDYEMVLNAKHQENLAKNTSQEYVENQKHNLNSKRLDIKLDGIKSGLTRLKKELWKVSNNVAQGTFKA